jgi:hypothetical protein
LIGTGAKTLITQTAKSYSPGMFIIVAETANAATNYMYCQVTAYVSGSGSLSFTVPAGQAFGSGTLSAWSITQAPPGGATNTFVQQSIQNQSVNYALAGGTATAATAAPSPAYGVVAAGQAVNLTMPNAATGVAMTLQLTGQAALAVKTNDGLDPTWPANFKAIFELNTAATQWILKNQPQSTPADLKAFTAVPNTPANGITITDTGRVAYFRQTTLSSGSVVSRTNAADATLVVSSGSTLGAFSAVEETFAVLRISEAGTTYALGIVNAANFHFDESQLVTTVAEGGAGAADSATTIYSTSTLTSRPWRLLGLIKSNQATSGTYVTAFTLVQPAGGLVPLSAIRSAASIATTSGTSVDFTGIPSTVKRITVMLNGVSTNGASLVQIQLGSATFTVTGYVGFIGTTQGAGATSASSTTGFPIDAGGGAAFVYSGSVTLLSYGSNLWVASVIMAANNTGNFRAGAGAGTVTLGGTLDRIRLTTVNGTDTFDAGAVNILYE